MEKSKNLINIVNNEKEVLHIFQMTGETSMRFSWKMWLTITLKVTKKQRFTLSLENTFLEKPQRDIKLTHPAPHPLPIFFKLKKIKTLQKWYTAAYHHNFFQALSRKFRQRILGYSEKFGENIKLQVFTAKHMVFLQIFLRVMAEDK